MVVLAALPSGYSQPQLEGEQGRGLQQRVRLRQLWLQEQNQIVSELPPGRGFSALKLAQEGGGQVVLWQADDGKLALSVNWSSLPRLLERLAESDVALRAFLLEPAASALNLTLQLETEK